jgi:hypothetical protein
VPWAISVGSLARGFTTPLVFRRGLPHVSWIVGYLLLVMLLITAVAEARVPLEARRALRLVVSAAEYLLQTLCHGLLLFVLPAYYAAATLTSPNAALLVLLAAAALLTAIDPWYNAVVHPRPWLRIALLGLAVFAGLNVCLALLGAPAIVAAIGAAGLAGLALAPALRRRESAEGWIAGASRAAIIAAAGMMLVWRLPILIPPAPMFIARAGAARDVVDNEPRDVIDPAIDAATVTQWGTLAAYSAIYAPAGMQQAVEHVWYRDGRPIARIQLSPILGGRRNGFRTFSRRHVREPVAGAYRVDVMTVSGQLLGRIAFTVTP